MRWRYWWLICGEVKKSTKSEAKRSITLWSFTMIVINLLVLWYYYDKTPFEIFNVICMLLIRKWKDDIRLHEWQTIGGSSCGPHGESKDRMWYIEAPPYNFSIRNSLKHWVSYTLFCDLSISFISIPLNFESSVLHLQIIWKELTDKENVSSALS